MEHFNESFESSELQTSSDVSVDTEPADKALEQDTQELESPPETQDEFPEIQSPEESDDDDDSEESFDDQPLEYEAEDTSAQEPETLEDEEPVTKDPKAESFEDEELEIVNLDSETEPSEVLRKPLAHRGVL